MDDCVDALTQIEQINRRACRTHVEENFNQIRMVEGYEAVYYQLLEARVSSNGLLQMSQKTIY